MPHFETLQVHAGQEEADPATGARAVPIYQTTSYVFRDCRQAADRFALKEPGNIYSRLTNPTEEVLEKRMAALDGGVGALAVSSGSSAVLLALQSLVRAGDHIVAQRSIYGGSFNLLSQTMPRQGVSTTFVDTSDIANIERAITEKTRAVYVETMGNPCSDLTDIDAAAEIAHRHGIMLVVDNTFATPYLLRPIEHGADLVVYSATKFLGGPRHLPRWHHCGWRALRLRRFRPLPVAHRTGSVLSRLKLHWYRGKGCAHHLYPGPAPAR